MRAQQVERQDINFLIHYVHALFVLSTTSDNCPLHSQLQSYAVTLDRLNDSVPS
jgi:hypothetical protein